VVHEGLHDRDGRESVGLQYRLRARRAALLSKHFEKNRYGPSEARYRDIQQSEAKAF
jgi:hypothetical protein